MKKERGSEIIIYEGDGGEPKVSVRIEGETAWLSQQQLAELYSSSRTNVVEHIRNIYAEGELDEEATCRNFRQVRNEGGREVERDIPFYNLDMIISLGYRIKSSIATRFRQWATARLREYIIKGFTMDDERLKNNGGGTYWKELLDRIRDIRSSEKVLYRQVLDLYATSIDYNPKALDSITFFKIVQNKLHYAVHGNTAAEVIAARADSGRPFMGLLSFSAGGVAKKDIAIAKNYLNEKELRVLNGIVSAFFELAEVKAMEEKPMYMKDWIAELDKLIKTFDKKLLDSPGTVSHEKALAKVEKEYKRYQARTLSPVEESYLASIKEVQKKVEGKVNK